MYPGIESYIKKVKSDLPEIPEERKQKLREIAGFIQTEQPAKLTFICTHNSRRSHLCQIWAATLAHYFGLEQVACFSGGTEATAFNPRAVAAIRRAGFRVEDPGGENPRYMIYFDEESDPLVCFSKTFDDPDNPQENFAAVMTCSDADRNCPFVPGASLRVTIPYVDPKQADGTPEETETYDERCRQIAAEMYYLMSEVE